jgi:hypothetical protein
MFWRLTRGWILSLNNMAYRESLGAKRNFDVYLAKGENVVVAVRQEVTDVGT